MTSMYPPLAASINPLWPFFWFFFERGASGKGRKGRTGNEPQGKKWIIFWEKQTFVFSEQLGLKTKIMSKKKTKKKPFLGYRFRPQCAWESLWYAVSFHYDKHQDNRVGLAHTVFLFFVLLLVVGWENRINGVLFVWVAQKKNMHTLKKNAHSEKKCTTLKKNAHYWKKMHTLKKMHNYEKNMHTLKNIHTLKKYTHSEKNAPATCIG